MDPQTPPTPRRQPTWSRLLGATGVVFFVVLALLVARVQAGTDPAVSRPAAVLAPPATPDPSLAPGGSAPLPGGSSALPGGSSALPGGSSAVPDTQDAEPPRTHAS